MYKLHTRKQELYFDEVIRLHYEKGYGEDRISTIIPVGHSTVNRWIRIFAAGKETGKTIMPETRIKEKRKISEPAASETVIRAEYERLKAKLEMAEIKAEAYEELIRVAEEKFKIRIRKKAGARR